MMKLNLKLLSKQVLFLNIALGIAYQSAAQDRPTYGIGQNLYAKIMKIENYLAANEDPAVEPDFASALNLARQFYESCSRCNPYELATLNRYIAWLSFQNEDLESTILHYQNIVALSPEIPITFEQEALLALAKICMQEEKYSDALQNIYAWKKLSENIPADIFELEARIHYLMENHSKALNAINHAISLKEQQNEIPQEAWYLFQRNLEYRKENFSACLTIQRKLVEQYSKDAHWRDLAVFYGLVGDQKNQIAAYDTAWIFSGLYQESDILNFSWLLQNADYPYKAAMIIQQAFNSGLLTETSKHYELKARAWYLAKEHGRAIAAMEAAANLGADGNSLGFLTDLYMEADMYEAAVDSANRSLRMGKLRSPGRLLLNKGIALFALNKFDQAEAAFGEAKKDKNSVESATKWQQYLTTARLRYAQLNIEQL